MEALINHSNKIQKQAQSEGFNISEPFEQYQGEDEYYSSPFEMQGSILSWLIGDNESKGLTLWTENPNEDQIPTIYLDVFKEIKALVKDVKVTNITSNLIDSEIERVSCKINGELFSWDAKPFEPYINFDVIRNMIKDLESKSESRLFISLESEEEVYVVSCTTNLHKLIDETTNINLNVQNESQELDEASNESEGDSLEEMAMNGFMDLLNKMKQAKPKPKPVEMMDWSLFSQKDTDYLQTYQFYLALKSLVELIKEGDQESLTRYKEVLNAFEQNGRHIIEYCESILKNGVEKMSGEEIDLFFKNKITTQNEKLNAGAELVKDQYIDMFLNKAKNMSEHLHRL